jgi:hypothetical protein
MRRILSIPALSAATTTRPSIRDARPRFPDHASSPRDRVAAGLVSPAPEADDYLRGKGMARRRRLGDRLVADPIVSCGDPLMSSAIIPGEPSTAHKHSTPVEVAES